VFDSKFARGVTLGGDDIHVINNWIEQTGVAGMMFNIYGHTGMDILFAAPW